jgi:hypothetical protein
MTTYRDWQPSLHPTGLAGTWGLAWGATLGEAKDTALAAAKDGVKARFVDLAPSDALPHLGADTQIDRAQDCGGGPDFVRSSCCGSCGCCISSNVSWEFSINIKS